MLKAGSAMGPHYLFRFGLRGGLKETGPGRKAAAGPPERQRDGHLRSHRVWDGVVYWLKKAFARAWSGSPGDSHTTMGRKPLEKRGSAPPAAQPKFTARRKGEPSGEVSGVV
jgi:hypothetical protein